MMRLDHVVLWVEDPLRAVEFYERVVGLTGVRVEEFRDKKAPFPSVRVNDDCIIDLMPKAAVPMINKIPGADGTAGHPVNHVCLAMTEAEVDALGKRLEANGTPFQLDMKNSFGARGLAPRAHYFRDLDGNILEARCY